MASLNFAKTSTPAISSSVVNISRRKRKHSGCIGCFSGCFLILFVICALFAGGFGYIYFMDKDEALGAVAVRVLKNQSINLNLLTDVNQNPNIPFDEKVAIKITYDNFLADYDQFPGPLQKQIKKNMGILIKMFLKNPNFLQDNPPPPELKELIQLLVPNQSLFSSEDQIEDRIWNQLIEKEKLKEESKTKLRKKFKRR